MIHNSMSIILINERYGIGLNKREDSDNLYSEKTHLSSRIQTVSPSAICSPDVALSNLDDTMNFMMNMQKLPRQMSARNKKNPWRGQRKTMIMELHR